MTTTYTPRDDDPRTRTYDPDTDKLTVVPFYSDPECYSCQRVGRVPTADRVSEYAFCGHIWDVVWKTEVANVVASDHRVWINGAPFEGRRDLARDLAATLVAAADAADEFWPTTSVESLDP